MKSPVTEINALVDCHGTATRSLKGKKACNVCACSRVSQDICASDKLQPMCLGHLSIFFLSWQSFLWLWTRMYSTPIVLAVCSRLQNKWHVIADSLWRQSIWKTIDEITCLLFLRMMETRGTRRGHPVLREHPVLNHERGTDWCINTLIASSSALRWKKRRRITVFQVSCDFSLLEDTAITYRANLD